jgi:hypothetical protein
MDFETFSHNNITHICTYKLSCYYTVPLQRTGTHLVSHKSKNSNESINMNLELNTLIPECCGSLFIGQVHFPFQWSFETTSSVLKQTS